MMIEYYYAQTLPSISFGAGDGADLKDFQPVLLG